MAADAHRLAPPAAVAGTMLVLAPRGRDAAVIGQVLDRAGMANAVCADLADLMVRLAGDVDGILMTEEALVGPDLPRLLAWIEAQPAWSDLPITVLATKQTGRRTGAAAHLLARLGNVVLLERPINAETLTSAAVSALRARWRQYHTRSLLLEQERTAGALRQLNETLEQRVEERARELDQARETLAFALDAAGMGSWDLDIRRNVARRSPQHDRIFGYDSVRPDWSLARFIDHVVAEDRAAAQAAFLQARETGSVDLECRITRADGVVRWITLRGTVSYDEQGEPTRATGVVMDATDRRQTADALHQAQKMEAIGQLTGGVAHDFNNLLTVIVGGLDMVLRRPEQTDRVVRLATAAMSAARRGEQLTQQLLAFSRKQMLRPETLDPNRLLRGFETLAQRAVGEAITLSLELEPDAGPIRIDPAQFESAVLNLVVNARDAMPAGGRITVATRRVRRTEADPQPRWAAAPLAAGDYVMISVADTGTGLDEATLSRAIEPFFTTKEVGRGSGLGLSQVYGFTRSAGGSVEIESTQGAGTVVTLLFPRSGEAATEERAAAGVEAPLRRAADGETILLVEDDEQVLAMAIDSLQELEYGILVARNAQEALRHLEHPGRIDVLFSDVVMPGGMNGAQLAVEARRLRPALKVLLTSGYVGDQTGGRSIGKDVPVLTKPYQRDELARQLRAVLAAGSPV